MCQHPEIQEHAALHEERLKILQEVREAVKTKRGRRPISKYRSKNFEELAAREAEMRQKRAAEAQIKKELVEKKYQYGEYIQEFY